VRKLLRDNHRGKIRVVCLPWKEGMR
jgi:hypothetical protein